MIDPWIIWVIGYVLVGVGLMVMISDSDTKWADRTIFIVWPIPVAIAILFAVGYIIMGVIIEAQRYLKSSNKNN